MDDPDDGVVQPRLGWPTDVLVFLACAAILLAATHGALQQIMAGGTPDLEAIIEERVIPVSIWVIVAPFLLGAARKARRATKDSRLRALVAHGSLATAWILIPNLLMRLPEVVRGETTASVLADAVRGVVEYGPAAAAAYVGLVAIGLQARGHPATVKQKASAPSSEPSTSGRSADGRGHLAIRDGVRIHMVNRSDVRWVEADGDHVHIHTAEKTYRTRATLAAYEGELESDGFLRIHRSALVHPRAIREIQPYYRGDYVAILHDGSEIRIPRTRDDVVEALLTPIGRA